MKELSIGIVGLGYIGRAAAKICSSLSGVKIAGVNTRNHVKGREIAAKYNTAYYDDVDALLQKEDLDGVIIATPNYLHRDPVVTACKNKKHVFVEKPLALSVSDCDAMLESAKESGTILMVGHIMRFFSGLQAVKSIIANNEIGRPMVAHCERTGWEYQQEQVSWKKMQSKSGGHLFHHIHEIDLLRWLLGEIDKVFCFADNLGHVGPEFGDEDDVILLSLRFKNGVLATMHYGSGFRFPGHFIRISGDKGGVLVNFEDASVKIISENKTDRVLPLFADEESQASILKLFSERDLGIAYGTPQDDPPVYLYKALKEELVYWIEAIRGLGIDRDRQEIMDGTAGREAVRIAEAALKSSRSGAVIQL